MLVPIQRETKMRSSCLILSFFAACTVQPSPSGADDTAGSDTGDDTAGGGGGDTGDDTGADTGGDTGEPADLVFELDGTWAGSTLTLSWVDPTTLGAQELVFGAPLLSAPATEAVLRVHAGAPPTADLTEMDPTDAPGLLMALYLPALHVDSDGDGVQGGAEPFVGAGLVWAVYLSGTVPADMAEAGIREGWNAIAVVSDGEPETADPMAIPLAASLVPAPDLTVGGRFGGDPDDARLMVLSGQIFGGGDDVGPLLDQALSDPWSLTVTGVPEAERVYEIPEMGMEAALEVPLAYADNNGSGAFEETEDALLYGACSEGIPVGLLWLPPPTELLTAFSLAQRAMAPGWMAVRMGDTGGIVGPGDLNALAIDDTCSIGR
jgi:hypothetical protein